MPELPEHLYLGRGSFSGPLIGGYACFGAGPFNVAISETGLIRCGFIAPCDMRLERISYNRRAAADSVTGIFYKNTAAGGFSATGATKLHAGTNVDLDVSVGNFIEKAAGGADTLVEAARNILKNERVFLEITSNGTGTLTDFSVLWVVFITGHVNAESIDD